MTCESARPFDSFRMTLSGVEWVSAPSKVEGLALAATGNRSVAVDLVWPVAASASEWIWLWCLLAVSYPQFTQFSINGCRLTGENSAIRWVATQCSA